jgi:hypothetical protein
VFVHVVSTDVLQFSKTSMLSEWLQLLLYLVGLAARVGCNIIVPPVQLLSCIRFHSCVLLSLFLPWLHRWLGWRLWLLRCARALSCFNEQSSTLKLKCHPALLL